MRTLFVVIAVAALAAPVRAQSVLQLHGQTGYLGEYELSGTVSEQSSNGRTEFSGPLVVKHVGLCTHTGPQETTSQIKLQIAESSRRVVATLTFEGLACTYQGFLGESQRGFMNCANQTSLPFRLWLK
jgi:hypothetical protein